MVLCGAHYMLTCMVHSVILPGAQRGSAYGKQCGAATQRLPKSQLVMSLKGVCPGPSRLIDASQMLLIVAIEQVAHVAT